MGQTTAATGTRRTAAKRERLDTGRNKRFVTRGAAGTFRASEDVGTSLTQDRLKKATTQVTRGLGERGAAAEGANPGGLSSPGRWTDR